MTINLKAAFRETDAFIEDAEPDMEARFATPPSASAQDFAFGKSVWEVVDGNPDGASVSGVAGISLIGSDEVDARGRRKDEDKDGIGWDDVAEIQREQREARERAILENGQITMFGYTVSEEYLDQAVDNALCDYDAFAARNGLEGKDKDDFHYWAMIYKNAPEGSPQRANALEHMGEISETATTAILQDAQDLETRATSKPDIAAAGAAVLDAQGDAAAVVANATRGDVTNNDAVAANIDDNSVWLAAREAQGATDEEIADFEAARGGGSDSMAFLDGEREGPIITPGFNATAADSQQLAQAQSPEPGQPRQTSTVEYGLG